VLVAGMTFPISVAIRVFRADDRLWYWRVSLWSGTVLLGDEPTSVRIARKGYKIPRAAWKAASDVADTMVRTPP
jgi:hypothetical protein